MKNKELIDNYVNAMVEGNSKYLWDHKEFRNIITDDEERIYLRKMIQKKLKEMHENVEEEFEENESRFKQLLIKLGLEKTFS